MDTSGWANLFIRSEPFYRSATELIEHILRDGDSVVTSNYVLAELSALLMSPLRLPRSERLNLLNQIRTTLWVHVIHIDEHLDAASWEYLNSRSDKDFSLVDCSSFVVMQRLGLKAALTGDRDFERAGFVQLLKPR